MDKTATLFNLNFRIMDVACKVKTCLDYFMHHEYYSIMKRNKVLFFEENKNKVCYVCALGPSLKDVDLNRIKGDTIVVNRFTKIGKKFPDFVPTYYAMIDALFAFPGYVEELEEAIQLYENKGTKFFFGSKMMKADIFKRVQSDNFYFVTWPSGFLNPKKTYSLDKPFPAVQNVACFAIYYAMLMGYKKIVLLGCDFNSFASLTRNHCYEESSTERLYRRSNELFDYSIVSRVHENLAEYARNNGVTIINSTKGSLIDAYEFEIDNSLYY